MNSEVEIRSNGSETSVAVNGKEISGNIVHLAMEIKPLEAPKVVVTLAADTIEVNGVADVSYEAVR